MNHRISIWEQLAIAAAAVGGVLFGFTASLVWLGVVLQMLPPSVWLARSPVLLAGIFAYILGVGASCWVCGGRAQEWAQRCFEKRRQDTGT